MYLKGGKLCHPKNMLHWHKDYFELKATGKKQIQEKLPALPQDKNYQRCSSSPLYQVGQNLITGENFRFYHLGNGSREIYIEIFTN